MTEETKTRLPLDKHNWHPSPLPGQIVLVTTVDREGEPNLATKSWLAMVGFGPPPVPMLGCNLEHATARNILAGGSFVRFHPQILLRSQETKAAIDQAKAAETKLVNPADEAR